MTPPIVEGSDFTARLFVRTRLIHRGSTAIICHLLVYNTVLIFPIMFESLHHKYRTRGHSGVKKGFYSISPQEKFPADFRVSLIDLTVHSSGGCWGTNSEQVVVASKYWLKVEVLEV